jgi:hypothetical protein
MLLEPSIAGVWIAVAWAEKSFDSLRAPRAARTVDHRGKGGGGEARARGVDRGGMGREEF